MFKHMADSIKETAEKRFISQADKDKYDNYENTLREKNDTYTKDELKYFISAFDTRYDTVEGSFITFDEAKRGRTVNTQLSGNTVQYMTETDLVLEMEEGRLNRDTGEPIEGIDASSGRKLMRTKDFIPVKEMDILSVTDGLNCYYYDKNKNFIGTSLDPTGSTMVRIAGAPKNAAYFKGYRILDETFKFSMKVRSYDLSNIQSVGDRISDSKYEIKLLTRGKNLFNKKSDEIIRGHHILNPDGSLVENEKYSVSHYIPVQKGKVVINNRNATTVAFYDINKNLLKKISASAGVAFDVTNVPGSKYIRFNYETTLEYQIQVEFGEKCTSYQDYKEVEKSILLPVPLQKIGTVSDKLVMRGNKLFIEKNIGSVVYGKDTLADWIQEPSMYIGEGRYKFVKFHCEYAKSNLCICDKYPFIEADGNYSNCRFNSDVGRFAVVTEDATTLDEFKTLISNEPIKVLYVQEPEYIEVPYFIDILNNDLDVEIFDGSGNIHFINNIEGVIKCDIPKTTGAFVTAQSAEINNIIEDITELEKLSGNLTTNVKGEYGVVNVQGTNNGYISDIVLEGKTYNNLFVRRSIADEENVTIKYMEDNLTVVYESKEEFTDSITPANMFELPIGRLESNKYYTLAFDCRDVNATFEIRYVSYTIEGNKMVTSKRLATCDHLDFKRSSIGFIMPDMSDSSLKHFVALRIDYAINTSIRKLKFENIMLLQGDYRYTLFNVPFSGLKSAGDSKVGLLWKGIGGTGINYDFGYCIREDVKIRNKSDKQIRYARRKISTSEWINTLTIPPGQEVFVQSEYDVELYAVSLHGPHGWDINLVYNPDDIFDIELINDIKIVSSNGGNLLKGAKLTPDTYVSWKTGKLESLAGYSTTDYIRIDDVPYIVFKTCNRNVAFYREDKSFIPMELSIESDTNFKLHVPINAVYMRVSIDSRVTHLASAYVFGHESCNEKVNAKVDSKTLLYKDENGKWLTPILRRTPDGTKDVIKKHIDGKYYFHKNCDEMLLTGDENWLDYNDRNPELKNSKYFVGILETPQARRHSYLHCDKFILIDYIWQKDTYAEGVAFNATKSFDGVNDKGAIFIRILASRLETPDLEGFKKWLRKNHVRVVYDLASEVVHECSPIDVVSYDGDTTVLVNTNTVRPTMEVTVNNDLSSVVKLLSEKISLLENTIIEDSKYENRTLLQSMYSTDVLGLRSDISIFQKSRNVVVPSHDLYTLILSNIIVGKDNYDVLFMEELIDFYTMVGKLSYEMAEKLFETLYSDIEN